MYAHTTKAMAPSLKKSKTLQKKNDSNSSEEAEMYSIKTRRFKYRW